MSCLFNSLSYFVSIDPHKLRQEICDYLQQNKPIIDGLDTNTILKMEESNYIHKMRQSTTQGGAIEIQVACNIWNFKCIVKNIRNEDGKDIVFLPIHTKIEKNIIITWNGGHYEPVKVV
jgi:hypothetical protein|tara:strand:- start:36 stop:392 length:357 start_codon:yes stop_codon:yes gene_type:complete